MEKSTWKVLAIIFIILFSLVTLVLGWAYYEGNQMIEKEYECAYNVCSEETNYIYYDVEEICECYQDNVLTKTKYLS